MGVMRISNYLRPRKVGQWSREHDLGIYNDFGNLIFSYSRERGKHGWRRVWGDVLKIQ